MSRIAQSGFELDGESANSITTGTPDAYYITDFASHIIGRSTTFVRSGTYSLGIDSGLGPNTSGVGLFPYVVGTHTDIYVQFFLLRTSNFAAQFSFLHFASNATEAPTNLRGLVLRTNGAVAVYSNTGNQLGSDSAAKGTQTWVKIAYRFYQSGGNQLVTVRIDDEEICTAQTFRVTSAGTMTKFYRNDEDLGLYIDDFVVNNTSGSVNNSWPGPDKVVLLSPISDANVGLFTGGSGGTTNLYDAVDNLPPAGTATETNTTQIECASSTTIVPTDSNAYRANMKTYANAGIKAGQKITAISYGCAHGEDIATGTKTGTIQLTSNPAAGSSTSYTVGDNAGALNTYGLSGSNWRWAQATIIEEPSVTLSSSPVIGLGKTDGTTRVASWCSLEMYVAYIDQSFSPLKRFPFPILNF